MNAIIYKYEFKVSDNVIIPMHKIVKILKYGKQNPTSGILTVWVMVDVESESDCYEIHLKIHGTGHPLPDETYEYITTVSDGQFVWHIFDEQVKLK